MNFVKDLNVNSMSGELCTNCETLHVGDFVFAVSVFFVLIIIRLIYTNKKNNKA